MSVSVNASHPALVALRNLNKVQDASGSRAGSPVSETASTSQRNDGPPAAVSPKPRVSVSALGAVTDSLNRAASIADVASAAGQSVSELLSQMKQKAAAAMDPSQDDAARGQLNTDYKSLLNQVAQVVQNASFDGANVLDGSLSGGLKVIADADGGSFVTLSTQNMNPGGALVTVTPALSIGTPAKAAAAMGQIDASISNVNGALASLGAQSSQIAAHNTFVGKLTSALAGVDPSAGGDMAAESAQLQALQVKQQLGAQGLSIANQAPQVILSLFK